MNPTKTTTEQVVLTLEELKEAICNYLEDQGKTGDLNQMYLDYEGMDFPQLTKNKYTDRDEFEINLSYLTWDENYEESEHTVDLEAGLHNFLGINIDE